MNWKAKPTDPLKLWINNSMEMQILLACTWNCIACDQLSNFHSIAWIRRATMTLAQISAFVAEMHTHNAYIGRIRILGGEPTLHPKFKEIIEYLDTELVQKHHVGRLEVITNGSHPERHNAVKHLAKIRVSGEEEKQRSHVANLAVTPASLGYEGKMCSAPWHCGFSFNYYGFFPCSAGAGIARLRDAMKYQRLTLPVKGVRETWPELQELCDQCYHGLKDEHKQRCGTQLVQLNVPGKETWEHLSGWLMGKTPDWKVYGDVHDNDASKAIL